MIGKSGIRGLYYSQNPKKNWVYIRMKCDFDEEELNWNCLLIINVSLCVTSIQQVYINIKVQKTDTVFFVCRTQITANNRLIRFFCEFDYIASLSRVWS